MGDSRVTWLANMVTQGLSTRPSDFDDLMATDRAQVDSFFEEGAEGATMVFYTCRSPEGDEGAEFHFPGDDEKDEEVTEGEEVQEELVLDPVNATDGKLTARSQARKDRHKSLA